MLMSINDILVSVVVCTFNRLNLLKKCLESLINQSANAKSYEIIVVDNCSNDGTDECVRSFGNKVKYCYEDRRGLSHARNRGVSESNGIYVAFTDDDAIADYYWVENIIEAFNNSQNSPKVVGGRIELYSEFKFPKWLSESFKSSLGYLNYGDEKVLLDDRYLYGVNIAFDKRIFRKFNFSPVLGRVGKNLISNEESYIQDQIRKDGGSILYNPNMLVKHYVPEERLKFLWHLKRFYSQGKSNYLVGNLSGHKIVGYSYLLKEALFTLACFGGNILILRKKWIDNLAYLSLMLGYLSGKLAGRTDGR